MKRAEIYLLDSGAFLVISVAGIRTIVSPYPMRQGGDPLAEAERMRITAGAIEAAAEAAAPMLIPNVARSVST